MLYGTLFSAGQKGDEDAHGFHARENVPGTQDDAATLSGSQNTIFSEKLLEKPRLLLM